MSTVAKRSSRRLLPSRRGMVVAVGLPVLLAIGVAILGLGSAGSQDNSVPTPAGRSGPLGLVPVTAPEASSPECATFLAALPTELTNGTVKIPRRQLAKPAPAATVAWGDAQHDPVVLRCGLERPAELTPTSELLDVSGVRWLRVDGDKATTWYVVDRAIYIALTTPDGTGSGPLQDVSAAVSHSLTAHQ